MLFLAMLSQDQLTISLVLQFELEPRTDGLASNLVAMLSLRLEPVLKPKHHSLEGAFLGRYTLEVVLESLALGQGPPLLGRGLRTKCSQSCLAKPRPRNILLEGWLELLPLDNCREEPVPLGLERALDCSWQVLDVFDSLELAGLLPDSNNLKLLLGCWVSSESRSCSRLVVAFVGSGGESRPAPSALASFDSSFLQLWFCKY